MKSIMMLLVTCPHRDMARLWASELQRHGFAHCSVQEITATLYGIDGGTSSPKPQVLQEAVGSEQILPQQHDLTVPLNKYISQDKR